MDFATWVGLILAVVVFIVGSPWIMATLGVVAVLLMTFSFGQISQGLSASFAVFQSSSVATKSLIDEMVKVAAIARKEGLLVLEAHRASIKNPRFKKSVKWISDGYDLATLKEMLGGEMKREFTEYDQGIAFNEKASVAVRGVSVVTLLVGITSAARVMQDSDLFTAALSSGFLAALLPLGLSVFIFNPIAEKMRSKREIEQLPYQLVSMGVIGILEGMSPAFLEEKLKLRATFTSET